MIRRCAWCDKDLSEVDGQDEGVSYGICPPCVRIYFPKFADKWEELRRSL